MLPWSQMTQFGGVWYLKSDFKSENERLSFEKKVCSQFADRLKDLKLSYLCVNFAPAFTNWLPFYWKGYRQTTRYTYQIQGVDNLDVDVLVKRIDLIYRFIWLIL